MNRSFKVCWYCPTNLDIDKFQESTEILPTWGCLSVVSSLGLVNFAKNFCLNCLFLIIVVRPLFCGQNNLLGGHFWTMGRLHLLGGQINLLGGKCPPNNLLFTSLSLWRDGRPTVDLRISYVPAFGVAIFVTWYSDQWVFIRNDGAPGGGTQLWVGYGCAARSFDHHPTTKPEKTQICNLYLNHLFLEGPFLKPSSTFYYVNWDT